MATLRFLHLETLHHIFPGDIHKLTNGLPHTFSQRVEVWIPRQIVLLCPVLEAPTISYCQKDWLLPYVLVGEFVWEVGLSIQTLGAGGAEYPSSGNILDWTSGI